MKNPVLAMLAVCTAIILSFGAYLLIFTPHMGEALSLICIGLATSSISVGTSKASKTPKSK